MAELNSKQYCDRCSQETDEGTRLKFSEQYKGGREFEYKAYYLCDKCLQLFWYEVMDKFMLNPFKSDYALMSSNTMWNPEDILIDHNIIKRILKHKLYTYESMQDWNISPKDIWEELEERGIIVPEDMKINFMDQCDKSKK